MTRSIDPQFSLIPRNIGKKNISNDLGTSSLVIFSIEGEKTEVNVLVLMEPLVPAPP